MLTTKEIEDVRTHLDKAQNPLFFFDNDPDGLCSFVLLQKYIGRGKGIPIKSFPDLIEGYFKKVEELNPDYIFILDKPTVSRGFFEEVHKRNIPIVWIDHHYIDKSTIPKHVNYYNPLFSKNKNFSEEDVSNSPLGEPVTYLCYKISNRKEDLWLAAAGCISDSFYPEFYPEFEKKYPDLIVNKKLEYSKNKNDYAFDILYNSELGKIIKILSFGLKDKITNVIVMLKFLIKAKNPYEVLEENRMNISLHKRFNEIDKKYKKLISKAKENFDENKKILFFSYGGDMSISSDVANELSYLYKNKVIVVAFLIGGKANISIRGDNVRDSVLEVILTLENATGGGHRNAVGCKIRMDDLELFREKLENVFK